MRDDKRVHSWPENIALSTSMKEFLQSRTAENNEAVIVTGGEPLIYFNKIKDIHSHLHSCVHKKIITNGTLLTQEIVDYCNAHKVEINLSHDGLVTEHTRGVDVLKNEQLLSLIQQIKELTISYVVTNINCDIIANYEYIKNKLARNVYLTLSVISETGYNKELIDNFNYDLFQKTYLEYILSENFTIPQYYVKEERCKVRGLNLLVDGTVIDLTTLRPISHCTVDNSFAEAVSAVKNIAQPCPLEKCYLKRYCCVQDQLKTEHMCKAEQVLIKCSNFLIAGRKGE